MLEHEEPILKSDSVVSALEVNIISMLALLMTGS
jgi:hypothetical protein